MRITQNDDRVYVLVALLAVLLANAAALYYLVT